MNHPRTVWFLTHPQVVVEPETPVPQWRLSEVGRLRAASLAERPWLREVTSVWSSTERKAVQTAELLAGRLPRHERQDLGENDRSATGFVPRARFESLADAFFADPERSVQGWATASAEQRRIVAAVDALIRDPGAGAGDLVVVSHGAVGTLLYCHLSGLPVSREHDQPSQGHYFTFDRDDLTVHHPWRALEELDDSRSGPG